jgi:3-dehydroquinate dehydratase type I
MSALCLTLAEQSLATLNEKIRHYAGRVAFIEVRLDYLADPGGSPQLPSTPTRFIATCRPAGEGGWFQGPEAERLKILQNSIDIGFSWIDLEQSVSVYPAAFQDVSVLRSHHDFFGSPSDPTELYREMRRLPGQAVKLAVTPLDGRQAVRLLQWAEGLPGDHRKVILGMGRVGQPTRVLGPLLGSLWTYVVENGERTVAPGQFSLPETSGVLRLESWNGSEGRPSLYAVLTETDFGFRICRILNRLFADRGLRAACLPLAVDEVVPWLEYLRKSSLHFQGLAITGGLARGAAETHLGTMGLPDEAVDTLRRTVNGWETGSTGSALDLPGTMVASESRAWVSWLAGQFRFWTGTEATRDALEAYLEQEMQGREREES